MTRLAGAAYLIIGLAVTGVSWYINHLRGDLRLLLFQIVGVIFIFVGAVKLFGSREKKSEGATVPELDKRKDVPRHPANRHPTHQEHRQAHPHMAQQQSQRPQQYAHQGQNPQRTQSHHTQDPYHNQHSTQHQTQHESIPHQTQHANQQHQTQHVNTQHQAQRVNQQQPHHTNPQFKTQYVNQQHQTQRVNHQQPYHEQQQETHPIHRQAGQGNNSQQSSMTDQRQAQQTPQRRMRQQDQVNGCYIDNFFSNVTVSIAVGHRSFLPCVRMT